MSANNWLYDQSIYKYILNTCVKEDAILAALRELTQQHKMAVMQIAPEQGQLMQFLVKLIGAKRTLELGTFTGYSALAVAMALPEDGKVLACDTSEEWTNIGKPYWEKAGVAHKIDLRIAPAAVTLQELIVAHEEGSYDFAFIDADKAGYPDYYEYCLQLVRSGGLIAIDNVLWSGRVADDTENDNTTTSMRNLTKFIANDERVDSALLPIADGLLLARKLS